MLYLVTFVLVGLLTGCGPSRLEVDNDQGRLDEAAPAIERTTEIGQTFVSHRDRLAAIEVLLVVYGETGAPDGELTFHLRADPAASRDLVTQSFQTGDLSHNQPLRITFGPLPNSRGQPYFFFFEGTPGSRVTVWYNTVNAYGEGSAVFNGERQAGDLQFKTFYDYSLGMVAGDVMRGTARDGWLVVPLVALLFLPGYLALLLVVPAGEWPDPMFQMALAVGLSVAIMPLLLLFTTLLGLTMTPALLAVLLVLAALVTLSRLWALNWRPLTAWQDRAVWPVLGIFLILFTLTLILRMLQVRELVVPAWVDGVHHTMMTQLIVEQGRVPADYQPYLDIGPFIYHFGFHAVSAGLVWLTGLATPQALLVMGQVLNALVGVGVYAFTVTLMRDGRRSARMAGLVALGVVGTVSLMPAYYVTWGRYTQLTGLVVLPAAVILTTWWVERGQQWALLLAALSVAGLGLVHYRVLVFYAAFVVALLTYKVVSKFVPGNWGHAGGSFSTSDLGSWIRDHFLRVAVLAVVSLLLLSPWIARLFNALVPTGRGAGWFRGPASFNAVPLGLIDVGYDRVLLRLALLSLLLGLVWWRRVSILIGSWGAVVVLAANPNLIGGRETWLLSNASLVIALFLPMAVMSGALVGKLGEVLLEQLEGRWQLALASLMTGLLLIVVLVGAWGMLDIVNPATIIATEDDVVALNWVRENTDPDAGFVTNVRTWQRRTYMGADGGYWIPLLTGRRTLVPPAIYSFGSAGSYFQVQDVLDDLAAITTAQAPLLKDMMAKHNLEYVYFGAKGGSLELKSFLDDPAFDVVYSNGSVWIFRVRNVTAGASKE